MTIKDTIITILTIIIVVIIITQGIEKDSEELKMLGITETGIEIIRSIRNGIMQGIRKYVNFVIDCLGKVIELIDKLTN